MVVAFKENKLNITGNPHTHEWARYFKLRASVTDAFLQHKSNALQNDYHSNNDFSKDAQ